MEYVTDLEDASDRLLKIAQVARVWNVSPRTVWRDLQQGKIKAVVSETGRIRVPVSQLVHRPRVQALPSYYPRCGVYFVAGGDGLVKIGCASDVNKRMTSLATGSPVPLRLIGWIPVKDLRAAFRLEQDSHTVFRDFRAHGEWFRIAIDAAEKYVLARAGLLKERQTATRSRSRR